MNHSIEPKHLEFVEMISAALDGPLSPSDDERLEDHLAQCTPCARVREEMRVSSGLLRDLPREAMPQDLRASLLAAGRNAPIGVPAGRRETFSSFRWVLAPGAAALLLAVVWVSSPRDPEIALPDPVSIATSDPAEEKQVAAPAPPGAEGNEPLPGRKKESSPRKVAARSEARARSNEHDAISSRSGLIAKAAAPARGAVESRFRSRLLTSGSEIALDSLVPIGSRGEGAGVARSVTREARAEAPRISLSDSRTPSTLVYRLDAGAPEAGAAPNPPMIIQLLLRVEGSGRILEVHLIGAQTAPRDLTDAIVLWLTGAVIQPHDEGEPSTIALELEVPIPSAAVEP